MSNSMPERECPVKQKRQQKSQTRTHTRVLELPQDTLALG